MRGGFIIVVPFLGSLALERHPGLGPNRYRGHWSGSGHYYFWWGHWEGTWSSTSRKRRSKNATRDESHEALGGNQKDT